ncbi:MAG: NTP transferase domain-containing protein, partial [Rubripirellula sp.]
MQTPLIQTARLCAEKVRSSSPPLPPFERNSPVLVMLAAGKGTRFGKSPKCIQPVLGTPLARHTLNAFGRVSDSPSICLVGYEAEQVSAALGDGNHFV